MGFLLSVKQPTAREAPSQGFLFTQTRDGQTDTQTDTGRQMVSHVLTPKGKRRGRREEEKANIGCTPMLKCFTFFFPSFNTFFLSSLSSVPPVGLLSLHLVPFSFTAQVFRLFLLSFPCYYCVILPPFSCFVLSDLLFILFSSSSVSSPLASCFFFCRYFLVSEWQRVCCGGACLKVWVLKWVRRGRGKVPESFTPSLKLPLLPAA